MKWRIVWLAIFFCVLAATPSAADYNNGPINGTTDAWTINFGHIVSDSFVPDTGHVGGFSFGVWEYPGDSLTSVKWSITSSPLALAPSNVLSAPLVYGSGTATTSGGTLTDKFISTNQYGYNIDLINVTGVSAYVTQGNKYWLNLQSASVPSGDPVYWDENSGIGCYGSGCPSQAYASAVGSIPSEAFDVCTGCACGYDRSGCDLVPAGTSEPGTFILFGSGALGLTGLLRRKLNL